MGRIYETMTRYFARAEWQFAEVEDGVSVALRFKGDDEEWSCVAQAIEDAGVFLFYSIVPGDVPDERLEEVTEFIARANYGMLTGAFECSLDSGDLRYRTGVRLGLLPEDAYGADGLAEQLVEEAVRSNLVTTNTYIAGLLAVIGGAPAEETIDQVEQAAVAGDVGAS
jgi:hypothetical protein